MNMNDERVQAATPSAILNDGQLGAPKDDVTWGDHDAWAVHHVSSNRKLQW